jgi:hypothetical protein
VTDLTDLEQRVLAFEHRRWTVPGAKDQAVHDEFGLSMTRYAQLLNALLDKPEALVHDPMLVKRLRRLRETRRRARSA